jgi:ATP-dependent RNA helicase HelY
MVFSGADLGEILHGNELTGGDFVRTAKRLSDMLQQDCHRRTVHRRHAARQLARNRHGGEPQRQPWHRSVFRCRLI